MKIKFLIFFLIVLYPAKKSIADKKTIDSLQTVLKTIREDSSKVNTLLELARQYKFNLFIVDIMIPGINGLDLCKRLKKLDSNIPVLILSALGTTDDKITGFGAGANDYLIKPFEL